MNEMCGYSKYQYLEDDYGSYINQLANRIETAGLIQVITPEGYTAVMTAEGNI